MQEKLLKSPINPITINRVKKGQKIVRSLDYFSFGLELAPEDGFILREDRGQKLKGASIYIRKSDIGKIKKLKSNEEIVIYPWEEVDNEN